ncbi:MAG: helix-turn-helix transcriptional regulator [Vicinamibacterales bacterium]
MDGREVSALLSWQEVRALVPLSRATVWALRRTGRFPQPVQISANRIAWRASDLNAWIAERAGESR